MTTTISSALGTAFGTLSASKILTAAAILVTCLIVIRLLMKLIRRLLSQSKLDERVQRYMLSGIRLVLYIVAGIITPEGVLVMLPNKELASSKVSNYTLLGRRRVTRKVTASYDAPTETVKAACREALAKTEHILEDPAPSVYLTNYGDSSIEYTIYCWATPENYWDVHFALGERLREAFAAHDVEMTYDHLNVHIVENRS